MVKEIPKDIKLVYQLEDGLWYYRTWKKSWSEPYDTERECYEAMKKVADKIIKKYN